LPKFYNFEVDPKYQNCKCKVMQSKLGTQGGIKLVAVDNIRMKICRENILKKGVKIMPGINLKPFEHYLKSHAIDVD
jgi:hypothetical protein